MTREELLLLVNGKLNGTKLTLSEKTINEELDDMLDEFGDNDEANDKLVAKIANRLKRIDGNLHADVSQQVRDYKKKAKERQEKQDRETADDKPDEHEPKDAEEVIPQWAKELRDELVAERNARKQREATEARNALIDSVKNGLKAKFAKAGLEVNDFFAKTALSRLEIPEENADVSSLVSQAEILYNEDTKAAGWVPDSKPRNGNGGTGNDKVDEHEFDDIAELVASRRPREAE